MTNLVPFVSTVNANEVGELKGLLAPARGQGLKVAIIKIPVRLFAIDEAYQTPLRTNRSFTYLTENFDDAKLLPVIGVPHDEEGKIYLTDGYGRWKATKIIDERRVKSGEQKKYEELECMVILNAPTEPNTRRRFEAEHYAFQNKNVSRITPLQKHGAYECMKYPAALIINEMKEKYDFKFVNERGSRSSGVLGSYSELLEICRTQGKECADYIFNVCRKAGFNLKPNGYSTYVMRSLRDIWKFYPEHRELTADYLSKWLREREPAHLKAKAVTKYAMLDFKTACSLYLEDLLVDNVDLHHVRTVEGKSVSVIKAS